MTTALLILITTILNHDRVGIKPLAPSVAISAIAQQRADDLCSKGQWSHAGFPAYLKGTLGGYIGENLAEDYHGDLNAMNTALMNSPEHRANIMSPHYNYVGIGYSQKCDITVQLFAQKM